MKKENYINVLEAHRDIVKILKDNELLLYDAFDDILLKLERVIANENPVSEEPSKYPMGQTDTKSLTATEMVEKEEQNIYERLGLRLLLDVEFRTTTQLSMFGRRGNWLEYRKKFSGKDWTGWISIGILSHA